MSPWIACETGIDCPFCGKAIVTDYEGSGEIADDEPIHEECKVFEDEPQGEYHPFCEHVALFCSWGYYEPEIIQTHLDSMLSAAREFNSDVTDPKNAAEILAEEVLYAFHNPSSKSFDKVVQKIQLSIQQYEVKVEALYIDIGDGPQGGGPTYIIIFLKNKKKETRSPKSDLRT